MTEHIPVRTIETIDSAKPTRPSRVQADSPIYTRRFNGRYRTLRLFGAGLLLMLFFGTAWLEWNGRQAVLWDLPNRQFHIFGTTFWPQDFILLSSILIIAAFALFFITVLAGRVWCGYTCPQSVWTWIFMRVEQITEGDRNQRIKLDATPWSLEKLLRRGVKHGLWLLISLLTALAFVGYFTPIRPLLANFVSLELGTTTAFWLLLFSAATYANAGWLREKVCRDMCPYARFQSVMFDSDTLVIAYDAARGESRGPRKKGEDYRASGLGDCVDCTMCVQVCPTGIDISDGLQLECIGCGACIDACNSIMDKLDYPRGLVRYSSERALAGGKTRWLRPRLLGYAAVLLVMIGTFAWTLTERPALSLDVARDRGLFRENASGQIENIYNLKIINKTQQPRSYAIALDGTENLMELRAPQTLKLELGEIRDLSVNVALVAPFSAAGIQVLHFAVTDLADPSSRVIAPSTFLVPRH